MLKSQLTTKRPGRMASNSHLIKQSDHVLILLQPIDTSQPPTVPKQAGIRVHDGASNQHDQGNGRIDLRARHLRPRNGRDQRVVLLGSPQHPLRTWRACSTPFPATFPHPTSFGLFPFLLRSSPLAEAAISSMTPPISTRTSLINHWRCPERRQRRRRSTTANPVSLACT